MACRASQAQRKTPQDIKLRYASAIFLFTSREAFNIKGNDDRLVMAVACRFAALYIKFIGVGTLHRLFVGGRPLMRGAGLPVRIGSSHSKRSFNFEISFDA